MVYLTQNYSTRKPPGLKLIFCDLTSFQQTYTNLDLAKTRKNGSKTLNKTINQIKNNISLLQRPKSFIDSIE